MPGNATLVQIHGIGEGWRAGQHVRFRIVGGLGWRGIESRPGTVANCRAGISPLPYVLFFLSKVELGLKLW